MNLDLQTSPTSRVSAPPPAIGESLYEIDGASFAVGERTLLRDVTLTLKKGRVIGLIGHNGSGKSTLLKLLARQQQASAGSIAFEGRALREWDHRAFAREVAYLPQQLPSADGMTVRELVALGRYPWHGALGRFTSADREKVQEAMQLTDVEGFADRPVDSLSGGERQRVWIAMLIAQDSQCMLLDEPISALDIGHQLEVLGLVRRLSEERGIGVVVVLHDINMAARFCDELVALKGGALLEHGTAEQMMTSATLGAIYGVPMGLVPHPAGGRPISYAL
ncbi:ATP-binding cassette domain-containing protein [Paraburkholderia sp. J41]|uniref:ATP-binding cassette domain-containing protein n=1 Tax=Paraburkholderia sp. J41 TaxID=2805433 RepID=UPI002AC34FDA|nr:ATP-binding cassette domain-containing protein [Paraburkholderia sp. J41]